MFEEGNIVEIPLPDGRIAIGWIVHISELFKNAVGFIVFGIKGQVRDDVVFRGNTDIPSSITVMGPLYTHIAALDHYRWKVFAHQPITDATRQLTRREVGGNVYVADDCLGTVEELGEPELKPMLGMGMPVVYREIERAFGNSRSPRD